MDNKKIIFITGIGTDIGKTFVSGLFAKKHSITYWKPIQSLTPNTPTDADYVLSQNPSTIVLPSAYTFYEPISPHQAAINAGVTIDMQHLLTLYNTYVLNIQTPYFIIEGAGGLLSPLTLEYTNLDLIKALNTPTALVTTDYLGSLNHSLATHYVAHSYGLQLLGWIFNRMQASYQQLIIQKTSLKAYQI